MCELFHDGLGSIGSTQDEFGTDDREDVIGRRNGSFEEGSHIPDDMPRARFAVRRTVGLCGGDRNECARHNRQRDGVAPSPHGPPLSNANISCKDTAAITPTNRCELWKFPHRRFWESELTNLPRVENLA